MKFIGIIPARYQSTRFPGKPLAKINDKTMIEWVVTNAAKSIENVWVATDDDRIFSEIKRFGGNVVLTSPNHPSGTDRCAEAARILTEKFDFDIVINIQGDEPFIHPSQIESLKSCFSDNTQIATLIKKIESEEELFNSNRPKVVVDEKNYALYFSRSPIPFLRGEETKLWHTHFDYWAHIGMYAYRYNVLQEITQLPAGKLERAESLEQLRWLENGYTIKTAITSSQSIGIDTPDDLQKALQLLKNNPVV